jgi:hypothetical protein
MRHLTSGSGTHLAIGAQSLCMLDIHCCGGGVDEVQLLGEPEREPQVGRFSGASLEAQFAMKKSC